MAVAGGRLWVAVAGYPTGARPRRADLRLFVLAGTGWAAETPPVDQVDTSEPFFLATSRGEPCFAGERKARIVAACREGGHWRTPGALRRVRGRLVDFATSGERLLLLTTDGRNLRTYELADGHVAVAAPTLALGGALSRLGQGSRAPLLLSRGTRRAGGLSLRSLRQGRWTAVGRPLADLAVGPLVGGPVQRGGAVVAPVTEARTEQWPLRLAVLRDGRWRLGSPLNQGGGSAQGLLAVAGRDVVAVWQQHGQLDGQTYAASAHIAVLDPRTLQVARTAEVWSERNIGPGDLDVRSAGSDTWMLSTRASTAGATRGLQVHLDRLDLG